MFARSCPKHSSMDAPHSRRRICGKKPAHAINRGNDVGSAAAPGAAPKAHAKPPSKWKAMCREKTDVRNETRRGIRTDESLARAKKKNNANRSSHETPHRKSRSTGHLKKVVETFKTEVTELIASGQEAMQSLQIENNALRGDVLEKSLKVGINDLMVKQLSEQMQAKESELHDVRSEVESTHSYLAKSRDENAKVIADFFTARGMKVETGWLSHEVNVKKSR